MNVDLEIDELAALLSACHRLREHNQELIAEATDPFADNIHMVVQQLNSVERARVKIEEAIHRGVQW